MCGRTGRGRSRHSSGRTPSPMGDTGEMALMIRCRDCGGTLTPALTPLDEMPAPIQLEDGVGYEPTVPTGYMAVDPDPVSNYQHGGAAERGTSGCIVVNPADARLLVGHPDLRRSNGCCGHDGLDGPNRTCPSCGAEVATLRDDCWSRVEVRFEPHRVHLSNDWF